MGIIHTGLLARYFFNKLFMLLPPPFVVICSRLLVAA